MRRNKKIEILEYEFDEETLYGNAKIKVGRYVFQIKFCHNELNPFVNMEEQRGKMFLYKNREGEIYEGLKHYKSGIRSIVNWWNKEECEWRSMQIFLKDSHGNWILKKDMGFFEAPVY